MMKDPVGSVIIGVWASNDANQRQIFTVSTGDSVKHAKPTNGEGHDTGADPTGASVPIGSVSGIQLVTATDQVEPGLGYQVVEKRQVEVAGDREDVGGADLDEPASEVAAEGRLGRVDEWSRGNRGLDCCNGTVWRAG